MIHEEININFLDEVDPVRIKYISAYFREICAYAFGYGDFESRGRYLGFIIALAFCGFISKDEHLRLMAYIKDIKPFLSDLYEK